MMTKDFYPLSVVAAVPRGEGIRFLHPKTQYDISAYTPVVWAVLSETNGYQTVDTIVAKVARQFPDLTREDIGMIIEDLRTLGVIEDSRATYRTFHESSMHPLRFPVRITFDEIREYTDSARLPVADGEVVGSDYVFQPSAVSKLQSARRSCRSFSDEQISLQQMQQMLITGYSLSRHSTASAGGLYPLKIYFIVTRDQLDMPVGYYEYDPEKEVSVRFGNEVDIDLLKFAFDSDSLVFNAPVIVVIAADMERHSRKYGNRGYRYSLLEAGHVAQSIDLSATELGLATLEYGGFLDMTLADELAMDHPRVLPVATIAVGCPSDTGVFNATRLLERLESSIVGPDKPVRYVRMSTGGRPEDGESFFTATALYKPGPNQSAKSSYRSRFSGGTANSAALAQVKAIAEAYERYVSGQVRVDRQAKAEDFGESWLDPRRVAPLTQEQLDGLPHLQPFDPQLTLQWVRGESMSGETVWVPADLVFYPLSSSTFDRKLVYDANSSGVAAYTSFEGAVSRGILELVERDAIMRNWFRRVSPVRIAHAALPYHWRRRAEHWERQGRKVYVLDFSAHGAVVANVIIASPDAFPCFVNGSAASVESFDEAVAKAFYEAELGLLQALKFPPHRSIRPEHVSTPSDHGKLYAHAKHFDNLTWLWSGEEVGIIPSPTVNAEELLTRSDAVIVPLTQNDAPLQVVRVLSERLIPVNFGFASEHYTHASMPVDQVNEDALRLPHYFA